MPQVATSELVDRAKAASDMRDDFVTPEQWMYWATQERLALDLFIARSGWPLQMLTFDITVSGDEGGQYAVNPETGVMAIVCVHQVRDNRYRLLRHQNAVDFGYNDVNTGNSAEYMVLWGFDNLYLKLFPSPNIGDTYRVSYIPHPLKLVLGTPDPDENQSDSVAYPMGWEERVVLGMARRALIKEESDTRAIDSEIALWESRIEEACWNRVLSSAPGVRNTDSVTYHWTDRYYLPPYGLWTFV